MIPYLWVKKGFFIILCSIQGQKVILSILIFSNDQWECKSMSQFIISPLSFDLTFFKDKKMVKMPKNSKMLVQGQCMPRSRDFSIFLTPEMDSLAQKAWYMIIGIHSPKYKFKKILVVNVSPQKMTMQIWWKVIWTYLFE